MKIVWKSKLNKKNFKSLYLLQLIKAYKFIAYLLKTYFVSDKVTMSKNYNQEITRYI